MVIGGWCLTVFTALLAAEPALAAKGDWPTPRQNRRLTAIQPLPGKMRTAPEVVARQSFGKGKGQLRLIASKPGGAEDRVVSIADGRLRCYQRDGKLLWDIHPEGLNFESLIAAEDIDGDGRMELALTAGRPKNPLGAAVVIDAESGKTRFRYDVEPMSYSWFLQVSHFLPGNGPKQLLVCMHGYPPDKKFGYMVLFDFPKPGEAPRQRWRYDFDAYTCFPTILTPDVDGDGVNEICAETHSRMWILDALNGKVKQFIGWDVKPANVRSYGLVKFEDLNGDGRPDFYCIANFAQHHEVLLNENGKLKQAWAHGWDNSVTTSKIATVWPEPPIVDVDGDGKLEMIVSMFNAEAAPRWMVRVYDAVTGVLKATALDRIAVDVADVNGDGRAEILAEISTDPTRHTIDGMSLLRFGTALAQAGRPTALEEIWHGPGARSASLGAGARQAAGARRGPRLLTARYPQLMVVDMAGKTQQLGWEGGRVTLTEFVPPPPPPRPDFAQIPSTVGPSLTPPIVGDVDGDGVNEVVHYHDGKATVYRYEKGKGFAARGSYASAGAPVLADVDGDGIPELIVGSASPTTEPVIRALQLAKGGKALWEVTLHRPSREGMPYGKALYFQPARFTGRKGDDLYVYVGTPIVRSVGLDGLTGKTLWEKGETPGLERYYAPTVNFGAIYDANGDGKEDLVFTNPDYYCIASGPDGASLLGPAYPPNIFKQPSQGLYTFPAILENDGKEPTVCLVDGHYFQAAMSLHAQPLWYQLPEVGEARAGAEGFMKLVDGKWLMGFGRQNGSFACVEVTTGKTRWELPIGASASEVSTCDIDGDGKPEFLFGTSHGELWAVGDDGNKPRVLWKATLPASVGMPVVADVDGDGVSEILVGTADGNLCLLAGKQGRN